MVISVIDVIANIIHEVWFLLIKHRKTLKSDINSVARSVVYKRQRE